MTAFSQRALVGIRVSGSGAGGGNFVVFDMGGPVKETRGAWQAAPVYTTGNVHPPGTVLYHFFLAA
jgi:hypothetical protein